MVFSLRRGDIFLFTEMSENVPTDHQSKFHQQPNFNAFDSNPCLPIKRRDVRDDFFFFPNHLTMLESRALIRSSSTASLPESNKGVC